MVSVFQHIHHRDTEDTEGHREKLGLILEVWRTTLETVGREELISANGSIAEEKSPAMSVVVITPDRYATVRKTIKHLRTQKVCASLEILIVAPSARELELDESEMRSFLRHKVVEVGHMSSTARARAEGARQASAPVVALPKTTLSPRPVGLKRSSSGTVKIGRRSGR